MDCLTPDAGLVRPAVDVLVKVPLRYPGSNRLIEERIGESLIGLSAGTLDKLHVAHIEA